MASRVLLSLIVAALSIACVVSEPLLDEEPFGDLIDCHNSEGDVTLAEVQVADPGHTAGKVGITFTYPPKGVSPVSEITCIKAIDKLSGMGGSAQITGGGRGQKYVEIGITSKARGKADFAITIMGKPPPEPSSMKAF